MSLTKAQKKERNMSLSRTRLDLLPTYILNKAQEKRFDKKFPAPIYAEFVDHTGIGQGTGNVDKSLHIKQHLADELATQKKESYEEGYKDGKYDEKHGIEKRAKKVVKKIDQAIK